jgi:hypothetical protein
MHAYGSERAYVDDYLVEQNICYGKGPFLIGGGRPSRDIRVVGNYLYDVSMRIGYTAPYNDNCEVSDNVIVNGELDITKYKQVAQSGNLVIKKGEKRPAGTKSVLLANRFDRNRAHLVIYNWDRAEKVDLKAEPFLADGESFCLMDPQNLFGQPVARGKCRAGAISVPVEGEFAVFVVLKGD